MMDRDLSRVLLGSGVALKETLEATWWNTSTCREQGSKSHLNAFVDLLFIMVFCS